MLYSLKNPNLILFMNHIVLFADSSEARLKNYKLTKLLTKLQEQEFNIKHMALDIC